MAQSVEHPDEIPMLLPQTKNIDFNRRIFVEGSERGAPAFFHDSIPDELRVFMHEGDYRLLIGAVNKLRAESWILETSRCHAVMRWIRSPIATSFSSAINDTIDVEAVHIGREVIQEFLNSETKQRWEIHGIAWTFEPLPEALEAYADIVAGAADLRKVLPLGSFCVCCHWNDRKKTHLISTHDVSVDVRSSE